MELFGQMDCSDTVQSNGAVYFRRVIADIGRGQDAAFLMHCSPFIQKGYGFDFRIYNQENQKFIRNLKLVNNKDADGLDVEEQCCDAVFMLTVLEHLDHPYNLLKAIHRILKRRDFMFDHPDPDRKVCFRVYSEDADDRQRRNSRA